MSGRRLFLKGPFPVTLLLSIGIHGVILSQSSGFELSSVNTRLKNLEIHYLKEKLPAPVVTKVPLPKREPFLNLPSRIAMRNTPPPFSGGDASAGGNKQVPNPKPSVKKPALNRPDLASMRRKISLPPIDMERIKNPSYISYYQFVREKIKRAAYQNYTTYKTGEVYLSFILSSDGYLRQVRLIEEKSSPSEYLREIAMNSIRAASPFPGFPKELNYPQLSFNVVISFELE